jgi:cell division transport system permease protein
MSEHHRPGAIIPQEAAPLRSLTVTMTVMCYLACLAIGAQILINRAVDSWTSGLSSEVTVHVREISAVDIEAELVKAVDLLKATPGVAGVEVLSREDAAKLLEPWLGSSNLDELPVPRLIRVLVDEARPPDFAALEQRLKTEVQGASLDTHRRWEAELTRMARMLSLLSWAILVLIAISAVALVIFATRTVLDANRAVVDVLHLVGARDGYIARQIDRRFLSSGLWAGLCGMALGIATFALIGFSGSVSGSGLAAASRGLLVATPDVALVSYGALISVPLAATAIAVLTSRITLVRMLREVL